MEPYITFTEPWELRSLEEVYELLQHGDAAKRRAATAMNERPCKPGVLRVSSLGLRVPSQKMRFFGVRSRASPEVVSGLPGLMFEDFGSFRYLDGGVFLPDTKEEQRYGTEGLYRGCIGVI